MAELDSLNFTKVKIDVLELYGAGTGLDIFLAVSDRPIKICHADDPFDSVLKKYRDKGVGEVYIKREDYFLFVQAVRERLAKEVLENAESSPPAKQVKSMSAARDVLKTIFDTGEIDEEGKKLAKTLTQGMVNVISKDGLFDKFQEFKENSSAEYLHAVMTSYTACCLIDTFSWGNDQMKEKVALAALLCDITMNTEEFEKLRETTIAKDLPTKIFNHPIEVAQIIADDSKFVSSESLTIIKQHHERPNGKGFPAGCNYNGITVLTAVYIVSNYFVEQLFDEGYSAEFKDERMKVIIDQTVEKFHSGNYKKASEALEQVYG